MKFKDFRKKVWDKKTPFLKFLLVLSFVISLAIIVLACFQLFGFWNRAINVFEPLLGLLMLIQAIENYKVNRKLAFYSFLVAIFIFIIWIVIFWR